MKSYNFNLALKKKKRNIQISIGYMTDHLYYNIDNIWGNIL